MTHAGGSVVRKTSRAGRRARLLSLALVWLLAGGCAANWRSVPSLPEVKLELTSYVDSGDYLEDVERQIAQAERYLTRRLSRVERPAIVLDIDETSLSNWAYQVENDFCYSGSSFAEWVERAVAPPIEPTLELYRLARGSDVAVFFVTGRKESQRAATEENLRRAGFSQWEALYMRPDGDQRPSAVPFKSDSREAIEGAGYTVLLTIGDQKSDLDGGWAERRIKLPNPFYAIP